MKSPTEISKERSATADQRRALNSPLIVLQTKQTNLQKSFFGYAKNISRGGMFISSVNPAEPGCRFEIEFPLPHSRTSATTCKCEIVWKRKYAPQDPYEPGMGLKFIDLPEEFADQIDVWVKSGS